MDPALRAFVGAPTEEEADTRLEDLIETRLAPLVRKIVAGKLGSSRAATAFPTADLQDVAADALFTLLQRLRTHRSNRAAPPIENLDDYTAAVAYSVCAHHLRQRYPHRARLKNRLRYVLEHDRRFALWDLPAAGLHGGLARWRGQPAATGDRLARLEQHPEEWPRSWHKPPSLDRADPAAVLGEIFDIVGQPIEFDGLVGLVARVWQIDRGGTESPDVLERLPAPETRPDVDIDRRRFLEQLWSEIQLLPERQRAALLLNLRDARGAGLLWVLPVTGLASMRAIAATIGMTAEELAHLWNRLPLDDTTLAERLGCTRQQVINLRMSARKRLSNRLGGQSGAGALLAG